MITDRRALLILDVLFVLALAGQIIVPLSLVDLGMEWRAILYTALVVVIAALWILWRRHPDATWVPTALVVASLVASFVGDGLPPLLLVAFALIILVVVQGPLAGLFVAAALMGGGAIMMWLVYHQTAEFILVQVLAITVALGITWLIATLLRLFAVASHDAEAARAALAASIETEKELLLAQERAREAGELHDGLGHQLTAIGLLLNAAQRLRANDPEQAWATVDEARAASSDALQHMRTWVRAMHPVPLDELEDATAFQSLASRFAGTGLSVDVDTSITGLPPEIALVVRRCVQEGLTNVVRHAGASHARVSVRQGEQEVRVEIDDDGSGMDDAGPAERPQAFGLTQLRARVEELGGTLTTSTSTLGGLRLEAVMPV